MAPLKFSCKFYPLMNHLLFAESAKASLSTGFEVDDRASPSTERRHKPSSSSGSGALGRTSKLQPPRTQSPNSLRSASRSKSHSTSSKRSVSGGSSQRRTTGGHSASSSQRASSNRHQHQLQHKRDVSTGQTLYGNPATVKFPTSPQSQPRPSSSVMTYLRDEQSPSPGQNGDGTNANLTNENNEKVNYFSANYPDSIRKDKIRLSLL